LMITLTSADECSDAEWQSRFAGFRETVRGRLGDSVLPPVYEKDKFGREHVHVLYAKPAEFFSAPSLRSAWPYGHSNISLGESVAAAQYLMKAPGWQAI